MKEETRRKWLIPVLAGVLLAATAFWGYTQYREKSQLLTYLNNRNQQAFFEMVGQVENMEVLLAKSLASASVSQKGMLLSDIWQQANLAQGNLGTLPVSQPQISRTAKFFTQAGDFSYTLAKKLAGNGKLTAKEEDKLQGLHAEAGVLLAELQKIRARAADGLLTWGEVEKQLPGMNKAEIVNFADGITRIDKEMQRYPTLIYDGPFSDHIELRSPKGLTGERVSPREAGEIAARFLRKGDKPLFRVQDTTTVAGKIPAYRIHFNPVNENGPTAVVDVSRKGGHVIMMMVNRAPGRRELTLQEAEAKAGSYLQSQEFKNMEPTYSLIQGNTAVVSFAYQQKGVIVYPDLIKVKVALDNGDILGVEALGYLMSHHTRVIPQPKVTQKEAAKALNPNLKVQQTRLTIIPTEALGESLCYEFKGDLNGDPFIVYINALTGREEQILKVVNTKDGTMTM